MRAYTTQMDDGVKIRSIVCATRTYKCVEIYPRCFLLFFVKGKRLKKKEEEENKSIDTLQAHIYLSKLSILSIVC